MGSGVSVETKKLEQQMWLESMTWNKSNLVTPLIRILQISVCITYENAMLHYVLSLIKCKVFHSAIAVSYLSQLLLSILLLSLFLACELVFVQHHLPHVFAD